MAVRFLKKLMRKKITKKSKGCVYVGMSGGVDSSVSAVLLKKEGYEVVGVFMKVWTPSFLPCTWEDERRDAMRVAATLGIPLLTWDFEKEYKEGVADYMIAEYRAGRTPNPDVMCNREIKFGAFFRRAMGAGADFVATGHYAQVAHDKKSNLYTMQKGVDEAKDQSYFLWTLGQQQLSKTLFPIGGLKKPQVRALAKKFALPVADKKDSQGLCFMGVLDMKDFLTHFIAEKEGNVVNEKGEVVGTHRGTSFYTLGERHGFTVTKKSADDTPYYVIAKDLEKNTLLVSHKLKNKLEHNSGQEILLSEINFCRGVAPEPKKIYTAQVRYHGEFYQCKIQNLNNTALTLHFSKPIIADRGQSVVLYDGLECLGGGVI